MNGSTRIRLNYILKYFREVKRGAYAFFVQIMPLSMEKGESPRSSLQNCFAVGDYAQTRHEQANVDLSVFFVFVVEQDAQNARYMLLFFCNHGDGIS